MAKQLKRYVSFDPETNEFRGFFNEGRKDLPSTNIHEVNPETYMDDIGNHTHYDPITKIFYTPEADLEKRRIEDNTIWRNKTLQVSDIYMLEDFPITRIQRVELKKFRQDLRDYDRTGERIPVPEFITMNPVMDYTA